MLGAFWGLVLWYINIAIPCESISLLPWVKLESDIELDVWEDLTAGPTHSARSFRLLHHTVQIWFMTAGADIILKPLTHQENFDFSFSWVFRFPTTQTVGTRLVYMVLLNVKCKWTEPEPINL